MSLEFLDTAFQQMEKNQENQIKHLEIFIRELFEDSKTELSNCYPGEPISLKRIIIPWIEPLPKEESHLPLLKQACERISNKNWTFDVNGDGNYEFQVTRQLDDQLRTGLQVISYDEVKCRLKQEITDIFMIRSPNESLSVEYESKAIVTIPVHLRSQVLADLQCELTMFCGSQIALVRLSHDGSKNIVLSLEYVKSPFRDSSTPPVSKPVEAAQLERYLGKGWLEKLSWNLEKGWMKE